MQQHLKAFAPSVVGEYSNAQLIEDLRRGDECVFDQFVRLYHSRVYRLAQRFVRNAEDALDITQDVFLRTYLRFPDFQGKSQLYTWLYRVTVNLCIDFLRRNTTRRTVVCTSALDREAYINVADARVRLPSQVVEDNELSAYIREAIMQLSPRQREVFILRHWDGYSLKEIAHIVGRSIGTVKRHLFDARRNLQDDLLP